MFLDHAGAVLAQSGAISPVGFFYLLLRSVGRIAFPLYAFLLVEGMRKTKCEWRYLLRLLVFAVVSEAFFDLAFSGVFPSSKHQNVLWTLFAGGAVLWMIKETVKKSGIRRWCFAIASGLIMLLCYYLCGKLRTDYGGKGILLITLCGFSLLPFRNVKRFRIFRKLPDLWLSEYVLKRVFFNIAVFLLAYMSGNLAWYALFAVLPVLAYNEKKGYSSVRWKWAFYVFYPAHLFLLSVLCALLSGRHIILF